MIEFGRSKKSSREKESSSLRRIATSRVRFAYKRGGCFQVKCCVEAVLMGLAMCGLLLAIVIECESQLLGRCFLIRLRH